jgi:phospholipase/carboxylesterase
MKMNKKLQILETGDWIIRYRLPDGVGPHPVIWLLHGWTGDEDSMWIFASRLPEHYLLLAPRGLYSAPIGGYSWYPMSSGKAWPQVADFHPAIEKLCWLMDQWPETAPPADFSRFRIAGFSQGGALAYSFAMLHPKHIISLAGLASFLPDGAEEYLHKSHLNEVPVFISHGTKDHLIPVERARQAVKQLQQAGAQVHYCESDKGHKLSADCFRGMETFFSVG